MAGHNDARRRHKQLIDKAKAAGVDIQKMETTIPSGKTSRPGVFLEHVKVAVERFPILYEHYKQERISRWKTYVKEQKALHKLCMRIKGDPKLKKQDVVVAYGAGMFG